MGTRNWWQLLAVAARERHAQLLSRVALPHLVNAPLAPKWPPAVGQCGQVGVAVLFIIFLCFCYFFCTLRLLCFGSCPFLRLRHSRLFISNFISYEFVCFYRKPHRKAAAKYKNRQQNRPSPTRNPTPSPTPPTASLQLFSPKGYEAELLAVCYSAAKWMWFIFSIMKVTTTALSSVYRLLKTFKFKYFLCLDLLFYPASIFLSSRRIQDWWGWLCGRGRAGFTPEHTKDVTWANFICLDLSAVVIKTWWHLKCSQIAHLLW